MCDKKYDMAISMQNKAGPVSTGTQINDKLRGPGLVYSTHFPCCTCSYSLALEQAPRSIFVFSLSISHPPSSAPPSHFILFFSE